MDDYAAFLDSFELYRRGGRDREQGQQEREAAREERRQVSRLAVSGTEADSHVTVAIRVRPAAGNERPPCVTMGAPGVAVTGGKSYEFDHVFQGDATQADVFDNAVRPLVASVLSGVNATVLAYGQTGSGKTYTMQGPPEDPGVLPRALELLFASERQLEVSYEQIYNNEVMGLLGADSWLAVGSLSEAMAAFDAGASRRAHASTLMNAESSRSHAVFTVRVGGSGSGGAQLRLVDLAGSERVKEAGSAAGSARFTEAVAINSSLLALRGVVSALVDGDAYVPYRDSQLTSLLRDSLGGNCKLAMLACVSPDQPRESVRTLRFACCTTHVVQQVASSKAPEDPEPDPEPEEDDPQPMSVGPDHRAWIPTRTGQPVSVLSFGDQTQPLALVLHGYGPGAESENWPWIFEPLAAAGLHVVAVDMPGFGESPGQRFTSRSERNLDAGGPVDVVLDVMRAVGARRAAVVAGYDWGAGIALSLAARHRRRVGRLVLFHTTYADSEPVPAKTPALVLAAPADQFHSIAGARKLAKRLRTRLVTVPCRRYTPGCSAGCYERWAPEMLAEVVPFVSRGAAVAAPVPPLAPQQDEEEEEDAVAQFRVLMRRKQLPRLLGAMMGKGCQSLRGPALRLFRSLPRLGPDSLRHPAALVEARLWSRVPPGYDAMLASPRYFVGRQVWVQTRVEHRFGSNTAFLGAVDQGEGQLRLTHRAAVAERPGFVAVEAADGSGAVLRRADARPFTDPQTFPREGGRPDVVLFEDGVRADYSSALLTAKMAELAVALDPLVRELDWSPAGDPERNEQLQLACVEMAARVANITRLQDGVDRRRTTKPDVGRLATYGQGHCHGLSSVMAAMLLPFAPLLGIDLRYRCGDVCAPGTQRECVDHIDRHQWLDVSLRPRMRSFVVDRTFYGAPRPALAAHSELGMPVELGYSDAGGMYPQPRYVAGASVS